MGQGGQVCGHQSELKGGIFGLPNHAWRTITWREGSADRLCSRFARVRVRIAPATGAAARAEETLLIEWPQGRSRAHQVLALQSRAANVVPPAGRYRQNALAH
jgi:hypothetical protein